MKLKALLGAGLMTGAMTLAPAAAMAGTHSTSHHADWRAERQTYWCNVLDQRQQYLFGHYDQNRMGLNMRIQNLINRENARNCAPSGTIVDTLMANGNFKTLTAAVGAAGLAPTLSGGSFTVFAPTDQAFAKLPAGTVEALLADIPTLRSILTYHAVAGEVPAATAMTLSSAPTVNGKPVHLEVRDGALFVNDSKVVLYDIKTSNGVIHVIDTVLLP